MDKDEAGSTAARGDKVTAGLKSTAGTTDKGKKAGKGGDKTGKDKKSHEKEPASRPQSQVTGV